MIKAFTIIYLIILIILGLTFLYFLFKNMEKKRIEVLEFRQKRREKPIVYLLERIKELEKRIEKLEKNVEL